METLRVDCGLCEVRGLCCEDCVVSVLLGPHVEADVTFTAAEQVAVAVLAESGLVPPLRLIRGAGGTVMGDGGEASVIHPPRSTG